jgi:hypothetical protein
MAQQGNNRGRREPPPFFHFFLKPIRVASGGNVGGREAAVEPTRTYSRRFPQEVTRVGGSIARR